MYWSFGRGTKGRGMLRGQVVMPMIATLAITAASAGIITPWLGSRHQDMARARSMRNMRTLAHATRMYADDWGGTFPGWQKRMNWGGYSHNVWDQLIFPYVGRNDVYFNGQRGGFKSCADPLKQRVLSYGLNGLLICSPKSPEFFNGSVRQQMVSNESPGNPPVPLSVNVVSDPAATILFAELATEAPVRQVSYTGFTAFTAARWPVLPAGYATTGSEQWSAALVHWIDISPREWVETPVVANAPAGSTPYDDKGWDPTSGIARDMYGGGGNYAFVDGRVKFQSIGETVGLGRTVRLPGIVYPVTPGINAWRSDNPYNQWNPLRVISPRRGRGGEARGPVGY